MNSLTKFLIIALCFTLAVTHNANAEEGVALIIGNNDYESIPSLNNAENDAQDIANKLKELGWKIILEKNATRRNLNKALQRFESEALNTKKTIIFYAGHGIEYLGKNYIIPTDSLLESELDLRFEAISVDELLETVKRTESQLNLLILDSCRDNPLPNKKRGLSRGLTVQSIPKNNIGTAIIYAAAPGQSAQDGPPGENSIFSSELLKSLNAPDLSLPAVYSNLLSGVSKRTKNQQIPWKSSSMDERTFWFMELNKHDKAELILSLDLDKETISEEKILQFIKNEINQKPRKQNYPNPILESIEHTEAHKSKYWTQSGLLFDRNGIPINTIEENYYLFLDKDHYADVKNPQVFLYDEILKILESKEIARKDIPNNIYVKGNGDTVHTKMAGPLSTAAILALWGEIPGTTIKKEVQVNFDDKQLEKILRSLMPPNYEHLTIDIKIKKEIDEIILRYIDKFQSKSAFLTLIDASNFEILSLNTILSREHENNDDYRPHLLRPYEFGSVLKPIHYAIALDSGEIKKDHAFKNVSEPILIDGQGLITTGEGRFKIQDWLPPGLPIETLQQVFNRGSNIVAARSALTVGKDKITHGLKGFGFFSPLKIFYDSSSVYPKNIKDLNIMTMSYGHGIGLTQLHIAKAYGALLNGGKIMDLRIFQSDNIKCADSKNCSGEVEIIKRDTANFIRALLFNSVETGTSKNARVKDFLIMGQTGTAQRIIDGQYDRNSLLSSWAGGFQLGGKIYVIVISFVDPKGLKETYGYATGGWVAAPVAAEIAKMIASMSGEISTRK